MSAEVVSINTETVVDFVRKRKVFKTEDLQARFALTWKQAVEVMEGLEDRGYIERAWVEGELLKFLDAPQR